MQIDGSEGKFEINIVGNITKQTYIGKFRVKCVLSPLEEIEADKTYRELLGNNYHLADEGIKQKAFALAQCKLRIIEEPPFWINDYIGGGHILDSNVLIEVLEQAIMCQQEFIDQKVEEEKALQDLMTKGIKNGDIEREPEIENMEDLPMEGEEEDEELEDDNIE